MVHVHGSSHKLLNNGWEHGGGSVWGWWPYDPKTNLFYYGTGNPSVWNPDVRPGDNKWSMTVFARDVDTGIAKWGMQMTPHDEWDYDGINEVVLFDKDGKTYAHHTDRNGFNYTWDASNGTLLVAAKAHPFINWATSVDLKTGVPKQVGYCLLPTKITMLRVFAQQLWVLRINSHNLTAHVQV